MQEQANFSHNESNQKPTSIELEDILHYSTAERGKLTNEIVTDTFHFFRDSLQSQGYIEYKSVDEAYNKLPTEKLIVRREDPRNILKIIANEGSYDVGFANERYSNCVEWNPASDGPEGIRNAYLEGFTNLNSVVTVIGLERSDDDDLITLDDATQNFYGLERSRVRSFKGAVSRSKIRFINLRVPGHLIPENDLTDEEIEMIDEYLDAVESGNKANPVMVHRSYLLPTDAVATELEKAA